MYIYVNPNKYICQKTYSNKLLAIITPQPPLFGQCHLRPTLLIMIKILILVGIHKIQEQFKTSRDLSESYYYHLKGPWTTPMYGRVWASRSSFTGFTG